MKEIVIVSGKGGTGKTSLCAAFIHLAKPCVIADADVDAADLHLLLASTQERRGDFQGGQKARLIADRCVSCWKCIAHCRFEALTQGVTGVQLDPLACEGCGACTIVCPEQAFVMEPDVSGAWMISRTAMGPMVHARLNPGGENSGKLVSIVRAQARCLANEHLLETIIIDGPPGTGCAASATLTGASAAIVVTEATPSGRHDLLRIISLAEHFRVPVMVVINKADLNPDLTLEMSRELLARYIPVIGTLPWDPVFTKAQTLGTNVLSIASPKLCAEITAIWQRVLSKLAESRAL